MKTIIITVPDSFPMVELHNIVRQMGCILRRKSNGELYGKPINEERHGNTNVVRLPRRRKQLGLANPPTPPSAA